MRALSAVGFIPALALAQGYSSTCGNFELSGVSLTARCDGGDGFYYLSTLNLDNCIGNNDGTVSPEDE